MPRSFLLADGNGIGKNMIIVFANMNSFMSIDSKNTHILILHKGLMDGLDYTALTAEKEYLINFTRQKNKFFLVWIMVG